MAHGRRIAVIGLGYVGLPVAVAFARAGVPVIGFDIDRQPDRGAARRARPHPRGRARATEAADAAPMRAIRPRSQRADFFIVTVPTPIDTAQPAGPDRAARGVARPSGRALKRGDIVVYESTVYPGAVEEDCVPVLEAASGLRGGTRLHRRLFARAHQSGRQGASLRDHHQGGVRRRTRATLDIVAAVYGSVVDGRHPPRAVDQGRRGRQGDREHPARPQHRVHERAVGDLPASSASTPATCWRRPRTKWNFLPFMPGLVGGHCIGVDPYYLTHRAEQAGYHPEVILAGRRINDGVGPARRARMRARAARAATAARAHASPCSA